MINIQLSELDLSLEVAEIGEQEIVLDEHSTVGLQGPLKFELDAMPLEFGYLDLDLLGFPYHGLSAYQIAVKNGFIGSEAEWLASLKGEPGDLSPEGRDAVTRAEAAASSASGDAAAAAGFRTEAYTYSGYAGVHAQSAAEMYSQAVAARDATGEIAQAMTSIRQESEALLTDTIQLATATIQERVKAETARASAEQIETRISHAETRAGASAASASDNAIMAVEARNEADDRANAAILAESGAKTYADEARVEAEASRQAQLTSSAARDEAKITAAGVIIEVDRARSYADDSLAHSEVSRDERILAEAARQTAGQHAQASLGHSQTAEAWASDAGDYAQASDQRRIAAEGAAGRAEAAESRTALSESNADGHRVAAQAARDIAVQARDQAGISADAAATTKQQVEVLADAAGAIQSALSQRVDGVEARIGDAEGDIQTYSQVAVQARDASQQNAQNITTAQTRADQAWSLADTAGDSAYAAQLRADDAHAIGSDARATVLATTGVNLTVNGYVTGWRANNNGTTGTFTILGDVFRLVDPNGGTPFTPFEVIGSIAYFNSNVRINGNLVVTGTINTPALTDNATSKPVVAYNNNTVILSNNTPVRVHGLYIDVDLATSPIDIDFSFWASFVHDAGGSFIAYVQLVRSRADSGGTVLVTVPIYGSGMANDIWQGPVPMKYLDKPGETGLWHYYVQVYFNVSNMTTQSITARYGKLTELKNNPAASITTGTGSGTGVGAGGGTGGGGGSGTGSGGGGLGDPGGGNGGGGGYEEPIIMT